MTSQSTSQRREVRYRGMVQGVGFRYTVRRLAGRYQVTGYVRNLPDGRVVVLAEGPPAELETFFDAVEEELGSFIGGKEAASGPPTGEFPSFEISI